MNTFFYYMGVAFVAGCAVAGLIHFVAEVIVRTIPKKEIYHAYWQYLKNQEQNKKEAA